MAQPSPFHNCRILVVDDEAHQRNILQEALRALGFKVLALESARAALEKVRFETIDLLISDLQMPEMDGLSLLERARKFDPLISMIMVTGHGSIETAVQAMKNGADDYLLKPVDLDALEMVVRRVFERRTLVQENRKLQSENEALKRDLGIRYRLSNTLGRSSQAQEAMKQVEGLIRNRDPVLILGEPGTERDDLARMIHYNSPWAQNAFIQFECGSVPKPLHEAQLFGEETPAPPGVKPTGHPGLVEKAHLGTLLLSQAHELEPACFPRCSRVLTGEKSQRVGGNTFYPAVTRLILTSTAVDFEVAGASGRIKSEVLSMLMRNRIDVAPLRERREDIPLLVLVTAKRMAASLGYELGAIDKQVLEKLSAYDFPGNVKELEALVDSAVIRSRGEPLKLEHFALPGATA